MIIPMSNNHHTTLLPLYCESDESRRINVTGNYQVKAFAEFDSLPGVSVCGVSHERLFRWFSCATLRVFGNEPQKVNANDDVVLMAA